MIINELFSGIIRVGLPCFVFAYLVFSALRSRFRYDYLKTSLLFILLIIITLAVTLFFLTADLFFVDHSTVGIILWIISAIIIFRLAIKGSFFELLFVVLVILNLYVNIAAISRVILSVLGLNYHNALAYMLIRTFALIMCIPLLWLLLGKLYRRVIEFEINLSFWKYLWVIPALLYLIFYTKIVPDYWKHPVIAGNMDIAFVVLWTIVTYVVFFVTLFMLIQSYHSITAKQHTELISAQLKMQESQYEKLLEHTESTVRIRHDWRHHILTINGFAEAGQLENLQKYLEALYPSYIGGDEPSLCQNHVIDVILQHYMAIARDHGIKTTVALNLPKSFEVSETDLCVIFGNLVENAVEACIKQQSGEKSIFIKAEIHGKLLVLLIKNSYDEHLIFCDRLYYSTKHEGKGVGLASVSHVVKNHSGTIKISQTDTEFKVSVLMKVFE